MSGALKPCPFCGGEAATQALGSYLAVSCARCGASPDRKAYKWRVDAIAAWNRRAPTPEEQPCPAEED